MKNTVFKKSAVFVLFFLFVSFVEAKSFSEKATIDDIYLIQKKAKDWGAISGESLKASYKTNYIAKLSDGNHKQYVALRFLIQDLNAIKERLDTLMVVDVVSQKFIDAKTAYYVVNSKVKTKYEKYSKLAFKDEKDAKAFAKKYKGDVRDFEFTFYLATRDAKIDKEYYKKKLTRKYKKGKRIYENICKQIDPNAYGSLIDLKLDIEEKNICGKINDKNLQALSLYLWDIKRFGELKENKKRMIVPQGSKCPVCGMFVSKYPKWAAKIEFKDHTHYFDGVKDMIKYYFYPSEYGHQDSIKDIKSIKVTDYYSLDEIDGTKAWYVMGSNVYGPMGNELIPFRDKEEAKVFMANHFGKKLLKFSDIDIAVLLQIDK